MDYKEVLGYVTVAMAFAVYLPYYLSIVQKRTRPHSYTYLIGSLVSLVAFLGSLTAGGSAGAWTIGASSLLSGGVFVLALKYGTKDVKPIDAVVATAAGLAVIPWILTHDPTISVVLAALIDSASMFPTLRKTWSDSTSEPYVVWGLNTLKHTLAIFAVSHLSLVTLVYPAAMVVMNAILTAEILWRRKVEHAPSIGGHK